MFRRCEDEKMFYRPPLLEEPCAQTLSGKSQELSNGTRSIPVKAALHTLSPFFDIGPVLEWVSKDKAGGYHIVLQRGEPSRLFTRSITQAVNWPLYVMAKLQSPPTGIQIYQDRGPKVRHKGKGKGNKSKGKGVKGKGKSRKGGKGAKGGAVPAAPAAAAMDTSCTLYQRFGSIIERFYAGLFTLTHMVPQKKKKKKRPIRMTCVGWIWILFMCTYLGLEGGFRLRKYPTALCSKYSGTVTFFFPFIFTHTAGTGPQGYVPGSEVACQLRATVPRYSVYGEFPRFFGYLHSPAFHYHSSTPLHAPLLGVQFCFSISETVTYLRFSGPIRLFHIHIGFLRSNSDARIISHGLRH